MAHTPSPASCTHLATGESPTLCPSHCVLDGKQAFPHDPPLPRPVMSPWRQLQQRCTESTVCKDESSAECSEGSDTLMCSVSAPVWLQMSLQGFNRWRRPGSDFSGEARGDESTRARAHTHADSVADTSTHPQQTCSKTPATPTKGYTPTATQCTNRGRCSTTEAMTVDGQ